MIEYLPLYLMIALLLHVTIMRKVNHARYPYRMELYGRFHQLQEADAPDWLIDFWINAIDKASFTHGRLKWGLLAAYLYRSQVRAKVKEIQRGVSRLDPKVKEIHDRMDRDLAIILLLSSPYFATIGILVSIVVFGTIELARIVPAREARGQLINCTRPKASHC